MRRARFDAHVEEKPLDDNRPSLLTSRSTPSLPALVNYALSTTTGSRKLQEEEEQQQQQQQTKQQQQEESAVLMQRGQSQQPPSFKGTTTLERTNIAQIRRNSFSSFLTKKYEHASPVSKPVKIPEFNPPSSKRHRPRSFSEIPPSLASVERAPPVAMTTKTPMYEYYGFVMYLVSFVVLGIYLIWAYVPDEILHSLGITYYPKRYWALAIPIWLMTLVWLIFISFVSINLMNTAPFDSYYCITDEHANIMEMTKPTHDELHDLPISVVNAFLYQKHHHHHHQQEEEEEGDEDENGQQLIVRRKTKDD